jgi:hypothetical protein
LTAPKKKKAKVVKAKAKKGASKVKASTEQTGASKEVMNTVFTCKDMFTCHTY